METVNILWTGGWDSTYRVLQLSVKNVAIQPYYLADDRASEKNELMAIKTITNDIKKHFATKCIFRDLITIAVSDIPDDKEISRSYESILKNDFYGSQYDWLARFAQTIENLELSIHQDDKAFSIITKYGNLKKEYSKSKGEYYVLDHTACSIDLIKVFGNYHFPLLTCSKLDMKKVMEEKGLIYIMDKTWFCHHPIDDKPCGVCNPCIYTIEEGLEYRFNKTALRRYKVNNYIKPIKKSIIYRGLKSIFRL